MMNYEIMNILNILISKTLVFLYHTVLFKTMQKFCFSDPANFATLSSRLENI